MLVAKSHPLPSLRMRNRGASLQAPEKTRPTYTTHGVAEGAWTLTKKGKRQLVLSFRTCDIPENKHRLRSEGRSPVLSSWNDPIPALFYYQHGLLESKNEPYAPKDFYSSLCGGAMAQAIAREVHMWVLAAPVLHLAMVPTPYPHWQVCR